MPRTGARAEALRALMNIAGAAIDDRLPVPSTRDIANAGLQEDVVLVYANLGGARPEPRIAPGGWDLVVNGLAVELDEDLHFNRYRQLTLNSPLYDQLTFPLAPYLAFCVQHEVECLRAGSWGKRWTKPVAEREFGHAGRAGDLSGPGAPRWKQRAFYDFIKDLAPLTLQLRLSRLAVWDRIEVDDDAQTVDRILQQYAAGALREERAWAAALLDRILGSAVSAASRVA